MSAESIRAALDATTASRFDLYERRPGYFQLIAPFLHEDGDMVDIYLQESPFGENYVRVCDFGLSLMRLSYTFDVNSSTRQRILEGILHNNGISSDEGNLFLDTPLDRLYEAILQFVACVQKVCNMRYWSREAIRSTFYDDLDVFVGLNLTQYQPEEHLAPLGDELITVDWALRFNQRRFFVFGVLNNDKAKIVTISLLELQKANLQFVSMIVHEDIEDLREREVKYLSRNADRQYASLEDFKDRVDSDLLRIAGP